MAEALGIAVALTSLVGTVTLVQLLPWWLWRRRYGGNMPGAIAGVLFVIAMVAWTFLYGFNTSP